MAIGPNDEVIIADSKIQIFSVDGEPLREIFPEGNLRGHYGGIAFDGKGHLVATRVEKTKSFIQVFEFSSGQLKFVINSTEAKLKRPCGLATTSDFHAIVVDLGNDCIKKYRYH
jgi:tripartite motif-containing protein 2/3